MSEILITSSTNLTPRPSLLLAPWSVGSLRRYRSLRGRLEATSLFLNW